MNSTTSAILVLTTSLLAGCSTLFLPVVSTEPNPQVVNQSARTASLPDMPNWVKFVRFKPHTHESQAVVTMGLQSRRDAATVPGGQNIHPEHVRQSIQPSPPAISFTEGQEHISTEHPVKRVARVNEIINPSSTQNDRPCNGEGGYVNPDNERWLSERHNDRWTIQLISADDATEPCIDKTLLDLNATAARRYSVFFKGSIWHIALIGDYPDAESALEAASLYPEPWIRNFAELRERRCASVRRVQQLGDLINPWCEAKRPSSVNRNPVALSPHDDGVPSL